MPFKQREIVMKLAFENSVWYRIYISTVRLNSPVTLGDEAYEGCSHSLYSHKNGSRITKINISYDVRSLMLTCCKESPISFQKLKWCCEVAAVVSK